LSNSWAIPRAKKPDWDGMDGKMLTSTSTRQWCLRKTGNKAKAKAKAKVKAKVKVEVKVEVEVEVGVKAEEGAGRKAEGGRNDSRRTTHDTRKSARYALRVQG
jgi:hypothetical protein